MKKMNSFRGTSIKKNKKSYCMPSVCTHLLQGEINEKYKKKLLYISVYAAAVFLFIFLFRLSLSLFFTNFYPTHILPLRCVVIIVVVYLVVVVVVVVVVEIVSLSTTRGKIVYRWYQNVLQCLSPSRL